MAIGGVRRPLDWILMKYAAVFIFMISLAGACYFMTPPPPQFTIREIMSGHLDPAADKIWGSVGTIINADGTFILEPKTGADWEEIRAAAVRITELTRELRNPGIRAARDGEKSHAPWAELEPSAVDERLRENRARFDKYSRSLEISAEEVIQAAGRRDASDLMNIGERMQVSCDRCHSAFWYIKPTFKDEAQEKF